MSRTTVVLADDHHIVRQGLRTLLEAEGDFAVIGEEADGLKVVALVERLRPDVLLLDVRMPGLNGLEITRQIVQRALKTRIVILSMHANETYVLDALRHGAAGYVLKDAHPSRHARGRPRGDRGPPLSQPRPVRARHRRVRPPSASGPGGCIRDPHHPRAGSPPVGGRKLQRVGDRRSPWHQSPDRGDPSREPDAETRPPKPDRPDPICLPTGDPATGGLRFAAPWPLVLPKNDLCPSRTDRPPAGEHPRGRALRKFGPKNPGNAG